MSTFTDSARSLASSVAQSGNGVITPVISDLQNGTTPTSTALGNAIGALQSVQTAVTNFKVTDTAGAFSAQTGAILADATAVMSALQTAQSSIDSAGQQGQSFALQPLDPTTVSNLVTDWTDLLTQAAGLSGTANQIDSASSGPSGPGPALNTGSTTSGSSPGTSPGSSSSPTTLPPTQAGTPPPAPPATPVAGTSVLPAVTPAAALAIGLGGVLLIGVLASAFMGGPLLNPLPRRRRARRSNPYDPWGLAIKKVDRAENLDLDPHRVVYAPAGLSLFGHPANTDKAPGGGYYDYWYEGRVSGLPSYQGWTPLPDDEGRRLMRLKRRVKSAKRRTVKASKRPRKKATRRRRSRR